MLGGRVCGQATQRCKLALACLNQVRGQQARIAAAAAAAVRAAAAAPPPPQPAVAAAAGGGGGGAFRGRTMRTARRRYDDDEEDEVMELDDDEDDEEEGVQVAARRQGGAAVTAAEAGRARVLWAATRLVERTTPWKVRACARCVEAARRPAACPWFRSRHVQRHGRRGLGGSQRLTVLRWRLRC